MQDTWAVRDLPVLNATIRLLEQSYMVTVTDIAAQTGLDTATVATALETLDPAYVDFRKTTTGGDPRFWYVFKVTPEARRAVGQWPTGESLAARLAAEFAMAAQTEPDAERQGLLAYAARLIGDTLRDVAVRAADEVLAPAFGGVPLPELGYPVPVPEALPREDDFASLVPLPELPELLRPEQPAPLVGADEAGQAPVSAAFAEPAASPGVPESGAAEPAAPQPAALSGEPAALSGEPAAGPQVLPVDGQERASEHEVGMLPADAAHAS